MSMPVHNELKQQVAGQASVPARLLIIEDEPLIRSSLAEFLEQEGFQVQTAANGPAGLQLAEKTPFDLVLTDIQMPGMDGVEVLERIQQRNPETFVILVTAYGTVETAVEAFKRGAQDYLLKPLRFDEVVAKVRQLLQYRQWKLENQWLRREVHRAPASEMVVGQSAAMQTVMATLGKVARTRATVLILGESGTGKELIARALHQQGPDHEERFLAINCAAIPNELLESQLFGHRKGAFTGADKDMEGLFQRAGNGTLFLDEIGEMSLLTQAKILRAIEQKEILPVGASEPVKVTTRIIAATNKDLAKSVEAGKFREDLYYRLNVVSLRLPPLRERHEDIPELVNYLLGKQAKALGKQFVGVDHAAMRVLQNGTWKGNIRELDNVLQRAVILSDGPLIGLADLPADLVPDPNVCLDEDLRAAVAHFEKRHIERIIKQYPDKREAAKRLGLALSSLYRKIEELGVQ
ncbi:MAG TPA: sigma-54 dependent transcriptional regulator [Gemmatales bacterium]|nr:sigma-54 dependent transcriptional regulator [Gemmatales bacterium]